MQKLFKLILSLFSVVFLLTAAGCGDSPGKIDENIKNIEINTKEFKEKSTTVYLPEITGMKNESLQKKINENLKTAILALERKGEKSGLEGEYNVVYLNDRLLVIAFDGWNFIKDENDNTTIKKGIHIDLTSGKIYEPTELFKKNSNYTEEILKYAQEQPDTRLYDPGNETWQYGLFKSNWDSKKNNQFFMLTEDYLWVYTFSVAEEGLVPGYGIPYGEIGNIIDIDSNLWKAFRGDENRAEDFEMFAQLLEYEIEVDEREARDAANQQMMEMEKAEADKKAAAQKTAAQIAAAQKAADQKIAAAQKAADQKVAAAQKAAAQKAAAQKAAPKPTITWKTTKVVNNNNGTITINGQYLNNTNKTMTRTNWNKLTVYYKTKSGAQKSFERTINTAVEKVVTPGGVTSAWFRVTVPNDYKSFVKVNNQFNYTTR